MFLWTIAVGYADDRHQPGPFNMGDSAQTSRNIYVFMEVKELGYTIISQDPFCGSGDVWEIMGRYPQLKLLLVVLDRFNCTSSALLCVLLVSNTYCKSKMEKFRTESFCFEYTFLIVFLRLTAYSIFVVVEASQRLWVFESMRSRAES